MVQTADWRNGDHLLAGRWMHKATIGTVLPQGPMRWDSVILFLVRRAGRRASHWLDPGASVWTTSLSFGLHLPLSRKHQIAMTHTRNSFGICGRAR